MSCTKITDIIVQGTTPTFRFNLPGTMYYDALTELCVSFSQNGHILFEKNLEDVGSHTDKQFSITLTQQETFSMKDTQLLGVQIRLADLDGHVFADGTTYLYRVVKMLCKEVFPSGEPETESGAGDLNNRVIDLNLGNITEFSNFNPSGTYPNLRAGYASESQYAEYATLAERSVDLEDMTVHATTLPAGSEATAEKTREEGQPFHIEFGIPRGETGATGATGETGKSAYQYAVEKGYRGTEEEFAQESANLTDSKESAALSAQQAAISAQAAQDAANSMSFVTFEIRRDGDLYINRSERLGTTQFRLTESGDLEVEI